MAKLVVNQDKIINIDELIKICPFGAMENKVGKLEINAACKMCKLCVKKGPAGAVEYVEDEVKSVDKSLWKGIAVYVDHMEGEIHPVTLELIGKAKELAAKVNHPVYCVFMGHDIKGKGEELLH
jgi:electron transfer flavoprotein alpha subunit